MRDIQFDPDDIALADYKESGGTDSAIDRIKDVIARHPNVLNAIGDWAARMTEHEPAFADDEAKLALIMHSKTLAALTISLLEIENDPAPLGMEDSPCV